MPLLVTEIAIGSEMMESHESLREHKAMVLSRPFDILGGPLLPTVVFSICLCSTAEYCLVCSFKSLLITLAYTDRLAVRVHVHDCKMVAEETPSEDSIQDAESNLAVN